MTVIETSKILLECADWLEKCANIEFEQGEFADSNKSIEWCMAIRSIAIPAPLGSDDENQKD